jgi:hypothetical protein
MKFHPVILLYILAGPAPAAEDYTPPSGFDGHMFEAPLAAFAGIRMGSVSTATGARGKVTQLYFECTEASRQRGASSLKGACDPGGLQTIEGEGSYAVGEYYFNTEPNPWVGTHVRLFAMTYLFCARWGTTTVPGNIRERMHYCGNRIFYRSETAAQLAKLSASFESNHDRVLKRLIAEHGMPDGYRRQGTITVQLEGGSGDEAPEDAFVSLRDIQRFRWCGLQESNMMLSPTCPATVTQIFDPHTGWGMVVYATRPMYEFAYARHSLSDENNFLYVLLNGRPMGEPFRRAAQPCTGTRICGPRIFAIPEREQKLFAP